MTRPRHPAPNIAPLYAQPPSFHRHLPTLAGKHLRLSLPPVRSSVIRRLIPFSFKPLTPSPSAPRPHFWGIVTLVLLLCVPLISFAHGSALPSATIPQIRHASDSTVPHSLLYSLAGEGAPHARSPEETHLRAGSAWEDTTVDFFEEPSSWSIKHKKEAYDLTEKLIQLQRRYSVAKDVRSSPSASPERASLSRRQNEAAASTCACNTEEPLSSGAKAGYAIVVPILVILSGMFAGLTLGYMSLDETQLHVLATTGSEKQKAYAKKIIPIRKDGHLLLTTLLIANMVSGTAICSREPLRVIGF